MAAVAGSRSTVSDRKHVPPLSFEGRVLHVLVRTPRNKSIISSLTTPALHVRRGPLRTVESPAKPLEGMERQLQAESASRIS